MIYKDKFIQKVAENACDQVSKNVIKDLRKMKDGMQSGDDSGLKCGLE